MVCHDTHAFAAVRERGMIGETQESIMLVLCKLLSTLPTGKRVRKEGE